MMAAEIRFQLYKELLAAFNCDAKAALEYLKSPKPCREQAIAA